MMVRQNKWRASRYGLEAVLIDPLSFEPRPVREIVARLVDDLRPVGDELGCAAWLDRLLALSEGKSWADRQLALLQESGSAADVVRHFTELSRVQPRPTAPPKA
jgi:carboxylate-amine ligase